MSRTFSSLPFEIRNEIFSHLLTAPFRIHFDPTIGFKASSSHNDAEMQQILDMIDLIPDGRKFFYRNNLFLVDDRQIESFLEYQPPGTVTATAVPKSHIRRLCYLIQSHFSLASNTDYEPGASLSLLLDCPELKQLEIDVVGLLEDVAEFDRTFGNIADTCIYLGEKLGEGGFKIDGSYLYGSFTWTMKNLRDREFQGSRKWRGARGPCP
ncbi:MAG: hypothetical protein Q9166_007014 [cf. Caloplaca sp. 2 TL-2023]